MNQTHAALHALPCDLVTKLCRSKPTRLSLKQMYTLGRHVLESKNQGALVIPAVFLHQELPIRLSHALKMLHTDLLPVSMSDMPTFQHIARSYLEDISMVTQMPKPSTPQLEQEFTALLRNLEQRHKVKMMAISQGFKELVESVRGTAYVPSMPESTKIVGNSSCNSAAGSGGNGLTEEQEADRAIQAFFNRFYTINLGTRLLIGEHLALHDQGLNLVQRVNPLSISQRAIRQAQKVCSAHYQSPAPSVQIQTPNPDISTTYVDEFLHRTVYELLKNAMRATCEAHRLQGSPISAGLAGNGDGSVARAKLPPVKLVLVDGGEDVTIKVSDQGLGLTMKEMDRVWSYVHSPSQSSSSSSSSSSFSPSASWMSGDGLFGGDSLNKDYVDMPLNGSGHGLPLARLIARYFGGDLSLISMEGHGTDAYLSLYRDDNHLENFPEQDEEMLAEVDVFVNELMMVGPPQEAHLFSMTSPMEWTRSEEEKEEARQFLKEIKKETPKMAMPTTPSAGSDMELSKLILPESDSASSLTCS